MELFKGMGHGTMLAAGDDRVRLYLAISDATPVKDRERLIREAFAEALETYRAPQTDYDTLREDIELYANLGVHPWQ